VGAAALTRAGRAWVLLALAGLVCAPAALIVHGVRAPVEDILNLLISLSFIGCGLIAWSRQPDNLVGGVMILFGSFRGIAALLLGTGTALGITVGILLKDATILLFVVLLLLFPDGRLSSRTDRWILLPAVLAYFPLELVWMAFLPAEEPGAAANLFQISSDAGAADAVDTVQRVLIIGSQVALAGVLARRWWQASAPRRRLLTPALAGASALALFTVLLGVDKLAEQVPEWLVWAFFVTFTAVPIAMLVQMVRSRLAHAAVGDLLVRLQQDPAPEHLEPALARVLRDSTLSIAFWLPEYESYASLDGRPIAVTDDVPGRAATPIDRDGRRIAVLLHDEALLSDPALLDSVAAAAAFSLENARLQAELRARLDELRSSRTRIIEAAQDERRRLERNLHDGAQQRLVSMSLELAMLEAQFAGDPGARQQIGLLRGELASSLEELRELARGLHPAVLSDHGLEVALEGLVARAPLPVVLHVQLDDRLPSAHEVAAFYLVSESLTNVAKYAGASSVSVDIARADGRLVVEVADNGCGGATTDHGTGLRGLADRVEALDGRLRVWSPDGGGTRVRAEIPCV
jgi:signal transduction histidine kinase